MKKTFLTLALVTVCIAVCFAAIAGIVGKWEGKLETETGEVYPLLYNFQIDGDKLTGTAKTPKGDMPIEDGKITGTYATAEFTFERLMQDCCICQPAAFWRRRISERTGPFNAELQTAMDYDYWLRIGSSGGIIHHTFEKLAQSRLHKDAKTLAMRGTIFAEVFNLCDAHGGSVSYSYYHGLWYYRLYESWAGGATLRRILPRAYRLPAMCHFSGQLLRIRRNRDNMRYVARTVFSVIDRRSPAVGTLIRKAWRNSSTLRRGFS